MLALMSKCNPVDALAPACGKESSFTIAVMPHSNPVWSFVGTRITNLEGIPVLFHFIFSPFACRLPEIVASLAKANKSQLVLTVFDQEL